MNHLAALRLLPFELGKVHASRLARWELEPDALTAATGEAGDGVYAFWARAHAMSDYYRRPDRRLATFMLAPGAWLVDLTHPALRPGVLAFLRALAAEGHARLGGAARPITGANFQRCYWGLMAIAAELRARGAAGYIVPHVVPGMPASSRGRQVVVFRPELIVENVAQRAA